MHLPYSLAEKLFNELTLNKYEIRSTTCFLFIHLNRLQIYFDNHRQREHKDILAIGLLLLCKRNLKKHVIIA